MRLQRISWWVFLLLLVCACPRSSSTGYGSAVGTTDDAAPVEIDEALSNALDSQGQRTPVALRVVHGFSGNNDQGPEETALTFPASATSDSFWTGSFDGHEAAFDARGRLRVSDLDPRQSYTLRIYAGRTGNDAGRGRLTRYTVGDASQEVEVADNTREVATFEGVRSDPLGQLVLDVAVSPEGAARFAYIGVLELQGW